MTTGPFGFSDEARRVSDTIRQAIVDGHADHWMAFALADGLSDGRTYDTRAAAIAAQHNQERRFMFILIPWDDVTPRAAEVFFKVHRQMADAGLQLVDPEVANQQWTHDNRREVTAPGLDRRHILSSTRIRGGLILP
jgi:hypothetical protein